MTIQSWINEFMPELPTEDMTRLEAAEHADLKYSGTTPANLKKHGVWITSKSTWHNYITDGFNTYWFRADECSLCLLYQNRIGCVNCPLKLVQDGTTCFDKTSPWGKFIYKGNVSSLRKAVHKALKLVQNGG